MIVHEKGLIETDLTPFAYILKDPKGKGAMGKRKTDWPIEGMRIYKTTPINIGLDASADMEILRYDENTRVGFFKVFSHTDTVHHTVIPSYHVLFHAFEVNKILPLLELHYGKDKEMETRFYHYVKVPFSVGWAVGRNVCRACFACWDAGGIIESFLEKHRKGEPYWGGFKNEEDVVAAVKESYSPPYRWSRLMNIKNRGWKENGKPREYFQCPDCKTMYPY